MKKFKSATTLLVLFLCCLLAGGSFEGLVLCVGEDASIAVELQNKYHKYLSPLDHCSGDIKNDMDSCVDILLSTGLTKNIPSKSHESIYENFLSSVVTHESLSSDLKYFPATRFNFVLPPPNNSLKFLRAIILLA